MFRISNSHKEFSIPEKTGEGQEEDIVSKYYKLTLMLMDTITVKKKKNTTRNNPITVRIKARGYHLK